MLDGTPVLDIKPYIPYADSKPEAFGGFAPDATELFFKGDQTFDIGFKKFFR